MGNEIELIHFQSVEEGNGIADLLLDAKGLSVIPSWCMASPIEADGAVVGCEEGDHVVIEAHVVGPAGEKDNGRAFGVACLFIADVDAVDRLDEGHGLIHDGCVEG